MEKIYSKINPEVLLHIIYRKKDAESQKESVNITPDDEFLQTRIIKAELGKVFKAHRHPPQKRITETTQESLIILKGSVKVGYYDVNDKLLGTTNLHEGDYFITLYGGHEFEVLVDALIYEHKNGPYNGLERDKEFIGGKNV